MTRGDALNLIMPFWDEDRMPVDRMLARLQPIMDMLPGSTPAPVELVADGTVNEIACGPRRHGLTVLRNTAGGNTLRLVFPDELAWSFALWALGQRYLEIGLSRSDGRTLRWMTGTTRDAEIECAAVAIAAAGEREGVRPGVYPGYDVRPGEWGYLVTALSPAHRASLKHIGRWTGEPNQFLVPFSRHGDLAAAITRATGGRIKTDTTTVRMPRLRCARISAERGLIRVSFLQRPTDQQVELVRSIKTARWDRETGEWVIQARYARSAARILAQMEDER